MDWMQLIKDAPLPVVAISGLMYVIWKLFSAMERKEENLQDLSTSINDHAIGQAKLITMLDLLIRRNR